MALYGPMKFILFYFCFSYSAFHFNALIKL